MAEPGERQKGESRQAFQAFAIFRDLGAKRSYQKVSNELSKSMTLIKGWGSKWKWQERTAAWDDELDRVAREQAKTDLKEMNDRHIREAKSFQVKALQKLTTLQAGDLSPNDAIRYMEVATKIERLARGEATEKVKEEHSGTVKHEHEGEVDINYGVDLSGLSVKELKQLESILSKVADPAASEEGSGGEVTE